MSEAIQEVFRVARLFWLRRWTGLGAAALTLTLGGAALPLFPHRYEASARVFVETQSVLRPLMTGITVQPDTTQQVGMLARTLISRPNLEKVLEDPRLRFEARSPLERDRLIARLSSSVVFASGGRENLFVVSYRDTDPARAELLVRLLVDLFVTSGRVNKERDTQDARRFIDEQIEGYERKLEEAENRLKEFKLKNFGYTGTGQQDSFSRMAQLQDELNRVRLELSAAEQSREALRRQLTGEETEIASTGSAGVTLDVDARIAATKAQLDDLLRRFTESHPDVQASQRLLAQLERQRERELEELRAKMASGGDRRANAASPVIQRIKVSLAEIEATIASLRGRSAELTSRMEQLRSTAARFPQIEAELATLNRDYDVIKRNYEQLVQRREQASIAQDVNTRSAMGDFRIVEPAHVKPDPVFPDRRILALGVLAASIVLGGAVTYVLALLMPTVNDSRSLRAITTRPVLGSVSLQMLDAASRMTWGSNAAFAAAVLTMLLAYGGWLVSLRYLRASVG
jgi:polysaccharide chain length determinant protein (PEP-CTERM system associated)